MPISDFHHIPTVLHYVFALRPRTVLDVGVGTGTYGFLIRSCFDLDSASPNRAAKTMSIEGVEIFAPYKNPVWDFAYDRVHLGDARALVPRLGSYDLILMNDVLEHFVRSDARALVREALAHAKTVIATTPNRPSPQGPWAGNEAETHRSLLDASDFPNLVAEIRVQGTTCFVCSTDIEAVTRVRAVTPFCPVARVPFVPRVKRRALREWRKLLASLRDRGA